MWRCLLCNYDMWSRIQCTVRDSPHHGIVRCVDCGHVQLAPVPSEEELAAYYREQVQRRSVHGHMTREQKRIHVKADTDRRINMVGNWSAGLSDIKLLEIGQGAGFFIDEAFDRGTDVDAIEYGDSMPDDRYDAVCAFHVLEHCVDPKASLEAWYKRVDTGGYLFVEVPNHDDAMIAQCPAYAAWHYQRAHIHYFTPRSLLSLLGNVRYTTMRLFGVQRYGLDARDRWLTVGKPLIDKPVGYNEENCPAENLMYRCRRERTLTSDTLCLIIRM